MQFDFSNAQPAQTKTKMCSTQTTRTIHYYSIHFYIERKTCGHTQDYTSSRTTDYNITEPEILHGSV